MLDKDSPVWKEVADALPREAAKRDAPNLSQELIDSWNTPKSPKTDYVVYWMGRRIEELSHEELLAAFQQMAAELRTEREYHARTRDMHRVFDEIRR